MICLPDVNVWIALTSDRHVHHEIAKRWLGRVRERRLAFCRVTEMGLLRLLTNAHVMQEEMLSHEAAWGIYEQWRSDRRVVFLSEPPTFNRTWRKLSTATTAGPNSWTDAYLAAFAAESGTTIATFDRRFPTLTGATVEVLSPT
jgi:uncharacterized protein